MAKQDDRICAVTAAMETGTGLSDFAVNIPDRYFDCGIAEQHAVTFCAGLARNGLLPVFAVYSSFLQRSYDQIVHDVALQNLKVIFAVDRAGLVGPDGETHHGVFDTAFLNHIPNLSIYSPATYRQLNDALHEAVYKDVGPVAVRYPKGRQAELPAPDFECGTFSIWGNESAPVVIISYGRQLEQAVLVSKSLGQKGVESFVLGLKRVKPIDINGVLPRLSGVCHVFFTEEGIRTGGIGQAFQSEITSHGYTGRFSLFAIDDQFVPHGSLKELLKLCGLDQEGIAHGILRELKS
jgi:1-deoxy-D-xylulose-5-phosphate synthase